MQIALLAVKGKQPVHGTEAVCRVCRVEETFPVLTASLETEP